MADPIVTNATGNSTDSAANMPLATASAAAAAATAFSHSRTWEALEKVRPEMAALKESDLLPILVDPIGAAMTVQGALPKIMDMRDQFTRLDRFDLRKLDNLETYALALIHANSIYQGAAAPAEHFQELVAEATALRELMLSDAKALAHRGYLSDVPLGTLKGAMGHRNVASDTLTLCNMLRGAWPTILTKTAITQAELDRAETVGVQLIASLGQRAQSPAEVATVTLERHQTYTLLVIAYDQVRRGVGYCRWDHGDAENIAPSIFAGKRRRNGSDIQDPEEAPPTVASPTAPSTGTTASVAAAGAPAAATARPGVGLPGSDPFTS